MDATNQNDLNEKIRARFKELPKTVQDAITSADVQKQLRQLADTKNLHLDQWQLLENNVMLTLLGFQPPEELDQNLKSDLDISAEEAKDLAGSVSRIVFEPIRQRLERELEHPEAKEEEKSGVEKMREQALAGAKPGAPAASEAPASPQANAAPAPTSAPVAPATPPPPRPSEKTARMPASGAYKPGEASSARKDVSDDPYRESPA